MSVANKTKATAGTTNNINSNAFFAFLFLNVISSESSRQGAESSAPLCPDF